MSRIGRSPITIPEKVEVKIDGKHIFVKGPNGELERTIPDCISVENDNGVLHVTRENDTKEQRSLHGYQEQHSLLCRRGAVQSDFR